MTDMSTIGPFNTPMFIFHVYMCLLYIRLFVLVLKTAHSAFLPLFSGYETFFFHVLNGRTSVGKNRWTSPAI